MAKHPALPIFTDAYLADTTHLSTIEHGAYWLLLVTMWRNQPELSLPDDDVCLMKYTKLNKKQWQRVKPTIQSFFTVENGLWKHGRLTDEYLSVRTASQKQSNRAKARWLKYKDTDDAVAPSGHSRGNASLPNSNVQIEDSLRSSSISTTPDEKKQTPSRDNKVGFDFETRKFTNVTEQHIATWKEAYPAINVVQELKRMVAWLLANPKNRKSNYERFINNWLTKSQDGAPASGNTPRRGQGSAHDTMGRAWASVAGRNPE